MAYLEGSIRVALGSGSFQDATGGADVATIPTKANGESADYIRITCAQTATTEAPDSAPLRHGSVHPPNPYYSVTLRHSATTHTLGNGQFLLVAGQSMILHCKGFSHIAYTSSDGSNLVFNCVALEM